MVYESDDNGKYINDTNEPIQTGLDSSNSLEHVNIFLFSNSIQKLTRTKSFERTFWIARSTVT